MIADVIIVLYVSSFSDDVVTQFFTENFIQDLSSRLNIGAGDDDTRVAVVIANETSSMISLDFIDGSSTTNLLWRLYQDDTDEFGVDDTDEFCVTSVTCSCCLVTSGPSVG